MRMTDEALAKNPVQHNHSILIYGNPKTGKSTLAATAAKLPEINRIFWFDLENGSEIIKTMGLTNAERAKFILYKIPDTRENPRAIETILKAMTSKVPVQICDEHGIVGCQVCAKAGKSSEKFCLSECKHDDLLVIDSGSQLSISALNMACAGKPVDYKPLLDDYGAVSKYLNDILTVIQQAQYTNIVMLTHVLAEKGEDGIERIYPFVGSKVFSTNVAKFFGTVIYTFTGMGAHKGASSSTFKPNLVTGSRLNIKLENSKELSMRAILVEGGVIRA